MQEDQFHQQIRPLADPWEAYRLRVGEFYFRSFTSGNASTASYLQTALQEFNSVVALQPDNLQAQQLRSRLLNNQNILGLPRDLDIIPDFTLWENSYSNYKAFITDLYADAGRMLTLSADLAQARSILGLGVSHLQGLDSILDIEAQEANVSLQAANAELQSANQRIASIRQRLTEKEQELQSKSMDLGGVLTTFATIGSSILASATGGAGLIALAPTLLAIGQDLSDSDVVSLLGDKGARDKLAKDAGGLKAIVEGVKGVIGLTKAINDLDQIPQEDSEYKELMREMIDAVGQQKLGQLHGIQSELAVQAAVARKDINSSDLQLAQTQVRSLTTDIGALKDAALTLVRAAQRYVDILTSFAFKGVRLFKRQVIWGCFGHAARLRRSMVSSS